MLRFFTDPDFLRGEIRAIQRKNFLCVFRNPSVDPEPAVPKGSEFVGYDLADIESTASALTNCGGFPDLFSNNELSEKGLLRTYERAREVQIEYRQHPMTFTQTAIFGQSSGAISFTSSCSTPKKPHVRLTLLRGS